MVQCSQFKENGEQCLRPAMKDRSYCYHHEFVSIGTDRDTLDDKDDTNYFDDGDSFVTVNSEEPTDDESVDDSIHKHLLKVKVATMKVKVKSLMMRVK